MFAIKGVVRNGRIEVDGPLGLPDGTEVLILNPNAAKEDEEGIDESPEGADAWAQWHDSLKSADTGGEDAKA
ncbi:MAG: hypothetical protein WCT04_17670 [Planctomycetota bacterium]